MGTEDWFLIVVPQASTRFERCAPGWVGDANLQEMIVEARHAAIADVIDYFEREIANPHTGVAAGDGAVAQVPVRGIIAAAFEHWDSCAGDPQFHTHVVISNKEGRSRDRCRVAQFTGSPYRSPDHAVRKTRRWRRSGHLLSKRLDLFERRDLHPFGLLFGMLSGSTWQGSDTTIG